MSDFNDAIIKEFRENHGEVGGMFEGAKMILVTTTGNKSGNKHTTPLVYTLEGDKYVIIASKGGAEDHPDWFFNVQADPKVEVEVGDEKFSANAEIVGEPDRTRIYAQHAEINPGFLEYQEKTKRVIPVVLLEKIN